MASNFATNLIAFIIVLGFLIFAHEAGHFLMAKAFRVRVLVFSFGFGKRLFGFHRGDTDYRVSLIPLGGYVRMAGDVPEEESENALEGEQAEGVSTGAPDEFLSRPKWQRFLILFAGPAANVLIAILFLAFLNMAGRIELAANQPRIGSVMPDKPAAAAGLQTGDLVVSANGEGLETWDDFRLIVGMNPEKPLALVVERGEKRLETTLVPERIETEYGVAGLAGVSPFIPNEIGRVEPGTAAAKAGLQPGDEIVSVDGTAVAHLSEFFEQLEEKKESVVVLGVKRGSGTVELRLPPAVEGAKEPWPGFVPPTLTRQFGPVESFTESLEQNWKMTKYVFIVLGRLFKAEGSVKDFTGPVSIARISGEMLRTGWRPVVEFMAIISLNLAIMNLLPIPVLDGGHIMILLLEGIARREFSIRTKERIQQVGFAFLATLMIVVLYHDILSNVMRVVRS